LNTGRKQTLVVAELDRILEGKHVTEDGQGHRRMQHAFGNWHQAKKKMTTHSYRPATRAA
jgi:hypothetical protein